MHWRIIALLMGFVALAHFNRIGITVAGAEQIIRRGFLSQTEMGVVYSAYLLPYTLCMLPGGWLIDRRGPRVAWMVVGFGSALFVALTGLVGLLCTGAAALWWALLLVRGLLGAASAPLHPTAARMVASWVPPARASLANGLVTGAALVGIASTYVTFGFLMDLVGWPRAFLVSAAVTLVLALVWTALAADHPPTGTAAPLRTPTPGQLLKLLRNGSLLALTASYALVGYFQYLFFYWAEFYFETVQALPRGTSRWYSTVLSLAMGAGMVLGGWLSDRALARFGPRRGPAVVPILGLLGSALAVVLGLLGPNPRAVLACFTLAMAAVGLSEASYWTASMRIGGARGGTAAALMNTGGNAGGLLAPVLTPLVSAFFGWQAGLGLASVVGLAAAVLWLAINPSGPFEDRPPAGQKPA